MLTIWPRIFLLGSAIGVASCLIMISLAVWLEGETPRFSPVDVRMEYEAQLLPIEQRLMSLLDNNLSNEQQSELKALRGRLMALIVPAEAKEFHLQLVLKLQQLEQALGSETLRTEISLENVESEIRRLIAERKW